MPYQQPRTLVGARRHRITIRQASTSDDGMGGQAATWKTVGRAWAAVTPLDERTKESLYAQQITARHAYHVDIHYRTGIAPHMQVLWKDKTLEVHSVTPDDGWMNRRLILQCAEVQ